VVRLEGSVWREVVARRDARSACLSMVCGVWCVVCGGAVVPRSEEVDEDEEAKSDRVRFYAPRQSSSLTVNPLIGSFRNNRRRLDPLLLLLIHYDCNRSIASIAHVVHSYSEFRRQLA
jgi:hypothetical protein